MSFSVVFWRMFININVEITCLGFVLNCSFKTVGIDMTGFVIKPLYKFERCQNDWRPVKFFFFFFFLIDKITSCQNLFSVSLNNTAVGLKYFRGSRDGAVVRALASHCCGPGFDSRTWRHMWVEFVVGSRPWSEGFSPGSPVFLPPQKPTFQIPIRPGNSGRRATSWKFHY